MDNSNFVSIAGTIPERPRFGKDELGYPIAEFYVRVDDEWIGQAGQRCNRERYFLVHVNGHGANSLRRYWFPGAHVTVCGQLDSRPSPGPDGEPVGNVTFIRAESLGYLSLSPILKAVSV